MQAPHRHYPWPSHQRINDEVTRSIRIRRQALWSNTAGWAGYRRRPLAAGRRLLRSRNSPSLVFVLAVGVLCNFI
jgi:hypothetical protein